jgi:hypothetical protein
VVTVQLSADGTTAQAVAAEGPTVQGIVKGVDAGKSTLTLDLGRRGRGEEANEEKTFAVAKNVEVTLDDGRGRRTSLRDGQLGDVVAGAHVTLRLSVDQKHVEGIQAQGATLRGTLKSVDAVKGLVTAAVPSGQREPATEERTYVVGEGATIMVDLGRGRFSSLRARKLADLPAGADVNLKLSVDQQQVMAILAEGATVVGTVKAVDADKRTITVTVGATRTEAGEDRTFAVAPNATIHVNGAESKLADVPAGDGSTRVSLKMSLDQKVVQGVTAGGAGR